MLGIHKLLDTPKGIYRQLTTDQLKDMREALGLTQDGAAHKVGISKRTIVAIEQGHRTGLAYRFALYWICRDAVDGKHIRKGRLPYLF